MLQRLLLTFALIFLFGLGQQGALTHAVGHIADLQQHDPQHDKSNHGTVCDKCMAYAELGSAIGSTTFSPPAVLPSSPPVTSSATQVGSLPEYPYSARAPPTLA